MKYTKIVIALSFLTGCLRFEPMLPPDTYQVDVVLDITDTLKCYPLADEILTLFDYEKDKEPGAIFRYVLVTDKKLNPFVEVKLEDGRTSAKNNENGELDYRNDLIKGFYDSVRTAIADFHKQYLPVTPLSHSECFTTISTELGLLAKSKASKRILLAFGDQQENEDFFSCYRPADIQRLKEHPEKVAELLQKQCPLPKNLYGVQVFFVFNPVDRNQDMMFGLMMKVYQQLLSERGATVTIQASNKIFNHEQQ